MPGVTVALRNLIKEISDKFRVNHFIKMLQQITTWLGSFIRKSMFELISLNTNKILQQFHS